MKAKFKTGINAYRHAHTTAAAQYADSIQLTQMLFSALLESLAEAEGHMSRNDFEKKSFVAKQGQQNPIRIAGVIRLQ